MTRQLLSTSLHGDSLLRTMLPELYGAVTAISPLPFPHSTLRRS